MDSKSDAIALCEQSESSAEWIESTLPIIRELAIANAELTTDDVWAVVDPPPEPRALGAAMVEARRRCWIEPTSETRSSSRRECHGRPVRVWRSAIYENNIFDRMAMAGQPEQQTGEPMTIYCRMTDRQKLDIALREVRRLMGVCRPPADAAAQRAYTHSRVRLGAIEFSHSLGQTDNE